MNPERDKFLREIIATNNLPYPFNPDFSTWEGFGKLWEWAITKIWWGHFKRVCMEDLHFGYVEDTTKEVPIAFMPQSFINPDRFADALYEFLKRQK